MKEIILCMRYSCSCKLCPRNKRCDEELEKESMGDNYEKNIEKAGWCNGNILVSVAKDKSSNLLPATKNKRKE